MNLANSFLAVLLFTFFAQECVAQGDYSFFIGAGYRFVRCNAVDTVIEDSTGSVVFSPMNYSGIGPITYYSFNDGMLVLKNAGREIRNSNVYEKPDFSQTFYFTISGGEVSGPFSKVAAVEKLNIDSLDNLEWRRPRPLAPLVIVVGILVIGLGGICLIYVWWFLPRKKS